MKPSVLIVPGWTNSSPGHWQSIWQIANPSWIRVEQSNWDYPQPEDWLTTLDRYICACDSPPVLVGHSLGCITIVKWAIANSVNVAGAFLVAPADIEAVNAPIEIKGFAPIPPEKIRFPTHIVASDNDEFLSSQRALEFAENWGSNLTIIPNAGHIYTASGYGEWLEGRMLLRKFMTSL